MLSDILGERTCIIEKGGEIIFSSVKSGIAPLIDAAENGVDATGGRAYDRIVGRAAALLYVRMNVAEVRARVISDGAIAVLNKHGIDYSFEVRTEKIINRKGDGICPMECAVEGIDDPERALSAIKNKLGR